MREGTSVPDVLAKSPLLQRKWLQLLTTLGRRAAQELLQPGLRTVKAQAK
jgi:hypothetical protein